jgi:hypothetical protein
MNNQPTSPFDHGINRPTPPPPQKTKVWSWGRGDDGRLGHADCSWKYVPRPVKALSGRSIKQVGVCLCGGAVVGVYMGLTNGHDDTPGCV